MNPLSQIITREIQKTGIIPFSRFMELALYCPVCGYYEQEKDKIGRRGDFFTNVSIGSMFGELLAFKFAEWLDPPRTTIRSPQIVEAGAHDGSLAADILTWLRDHRPDLAHSVQYCIVEPSPRRREWQHNTLKQFAGSVEWISNLSNTTSVSGIIFANELLDAMPVHRWRWNATSKSWSEWGVGVEGEKFVWRTMPTTDAALPNTPEALKEILPDGFTTETCPAAVDWWSHAARVLECGKLLTVDYGLTADELWRPERRDGTLRTYRKHHVGADLLASVGEQDLTAHVNFAALASAGEARGLRTDAMVTQEAFLTGIAARTWDEQLDFGEWTPERTRQFKTLIHPEHFGRSFRVLVQSVA